MFEQKLVHVLEYNGDEGQIAWFCDESKVYKSAFTYICVWFESTWNCNVGTKDWMNVNKGRYGVRV